METDLYKIISKEARKDAQGRIGRLERIEPRAFAHSDGYWMEVLEDERELKDYRKRKEDYDKQGWFKKLFDNEPEYPAGKPNNPSKGRGR
jgi:hypothetical protein